uniref:Ribosomal protein L1 n=1 Tax=Candidozyma auris TaxID=498019 RepID=A0A0L0P7N2_CANAR
MARTKQTRSRASKQEAPAQKKQKVASQLPKASPAKNATPIKESKKSGSPETSAKEYGYVSKKQVIAALEELKKFLERQSEGSKNDKSQLFDEDNDDDDDDELKSLYVEVQKKKFFNTRPGFKAKLIPLPKPYMTSKSDFKTCFFVRDSFIKTNEDLEKVEEAKIPTLSKIITLNQLKTIYHPFEKRRELYKEYDLFVADDAILSSLPNVLGKTMYDNQKTKFPVQIRPYMSDLPKELSLEKLKAQIERVMNSAPYLPPMGTTAYFKIGAFNKNFTEEELLENLHTILKEFDEKELLTVGVQTQWSPVLPLFYTEKIYSDEDVLQDTPEETEKEITEDVFAKALFELADEETVNKALKENRMGSLARSKA